MSDGQPPEKPTTQLPAVPAWAIELTRTVKDGFARSEANHELLAGEVKSAKSDIRGLVSKVGSLEEWKQQVTGEVKSRLDTHSIKVQRISDHDLEQEAKIADMLIFQTHVDGRFTSQDKRLEVIEQKTDYQTQVLTELRGVAANPMVRKLAYAVGAAILTYLTARGVR